MSTPEKSEAKKLAPGAVPALARGVRLRFDQARKAWVLLAPERVLMPDEVAVEIIKRLDGKADFAAIVGDLAEAFSAPREEIAKDVLAFLQDLIDKGMVTLDAP